MERRPSFKEASLISNTINNSGIFYIEEEEIMFTEADIDFELKKLTKEEQELAILGMMMISFDNYETVSTQLMEEDFAYYKDFFKITNQLYTENGCATFDSIATLGEELGIIKTSEPRYNGQFRDITPNKGYQIITKMIVYSDESFDVQLLIDLLKGKVTPPPLPFDVCHNTSLPNEDMTTNPPAPILYPIWQKDKDLNKYIYIQEPACNGAEKENFSFKPLQPRNTSVTLPLQPTEPESPVSKKIRDWIEGTTAWFTSSQLDSELGIKTESDKSNRRMILKRLCDKGNVQRHPQHEGRYRYVNTSIERLNLKTATPNSLDIKLPFKIEDYVKLYPSNVVVVAGAANAGKTAFMLNVIKMNLKNYANRIRYFCSEGGAEELRSRLDLFPMSERDLDKFEAIRKTANFADAIVPDWINIIDFLEMTTDLWVVNDYLTTIQNKLTTGIGIVAIQKKGGARLGRGAEFGLEKPKLYVTMDSGKLTIIKAKDWRDKKVNPNGMTAKFKLVNGCKFIITKQLDSVEKPDVQIPPPAQANFVAGYDDGIADEDRLIWKGEVR